MNSLSGSFLNTFKGTTGEFEIVRVLGAYAGFVLITSIPVFVAWELALGRAFDLNTYCVVVPVFVVGILGAVSGAAGWKDNKTAQARATEAHTHAALAQTADRYPEQHESVPEGVAEAADQTADAAVKRAAEIKDKVADGG